MVSRRLRRRAIFAFSASAVAFIASISLFSPDRPAEVAVASSNAETLAPANKPVSAVPDEQPPKLAGGLPGVAKICLVETEVQLKPQDEIFIPATTVFEDEGQNTGNPKDSKTWHYEIKERFGLPAQISTLDAVSLRKSKPCAEAKVLMLARESESDKTMRASDHHVFTMTDVIDYPIPTVPPSIETGKLVDDIGVQAMLTVDINQTVVQSKPAALDDATKAANCLAGARKLAAYLGGGTGQQRSMNIEIGHVGAANVTYGCPFGPKQKPDFAVYWEGKARPPADIVALIAKGGEFVTGATRAEITAEMSACIAAALKPDAAEMADREIRGVKIECQAFSRDGGGGSVTIYRRFGPDPVQPEMSEKAATGVDQISRDLKVQGDRKAADAVRFAQWYLDPSVPQSVKAFAMVVARVISLQQRCPSSKSHDDKITRWALDAGVRSSDIEPGGRYASLMTKMLAEMQAGATKESVAEACEAIRKYD
jgi:hypothetical protein